MPTRIRSQLAHSRSSKHTSTVSGVVPFQVYNLLNRKTVTSTGHPYRLLGKTDRDIGGSFSLDGFEWGGNPAPEFSLRGNVPPSSIERTYKGPIYPNYSNRSTAPSGGDQTAFMSNAHLIAYGTRGIARSIPTMPLFNVGQLAGELKQVPRLFNPLMWKKTVDSIRRSPSWQKAKKAGQDASDEYLNYQFGWRPFLKDLGDFLDVTDDLEKRVKFLLKNSGKTTRRKRVLSESKTQMPSVLLSNNSFGSPVLHNDFYLQTGKLYLETTFTEKVWFSGGFTFLLEGNGNLADPKTRNHIRRMLNSSGLNPDTAWNLAPWTWALGWIGSSSDFSRNVQHFSQDGLVMRYGYIMRSLTQTDTYVLQGLQFREKIEGPSESYLTQTVSYLRKQRMRATPFGFGLIPGSFTPRQWSIIAALGISNMPRQLIP